MKTFVLDKTLFPDAVLEDGSFRVLHIYVSIKTKRVIAMVWLNGQFEHRIDCPWCEPFEGLDFEVFEQDFRVLVQKKLNFDCKEMLVIDLDALWDEQANAAKA